MIRATEDYSLCIRFIPTSCDHGHGRPYNKLCLFPCHAIRATEDYSLCIMFIPKLCDHGHGGPYNKYHVYSHVMRSGPQRTIHCILCLFQRYAITATKDHTISVMFIPMSYDHDNRRPLCLFPCHMITTTEDRPCIVYYVYLWINI